MLPATIPDQFGLSGLARVVRLYRETTITLSQAAIEIGDPLDSLDTDRQRALAARLDTGIPRAAWDGPSGPYLHAEAVAAWKIGVPGPNPQP